MTEELTLSEILSNAFNKDYTADQAVTDLGKLMQEATQTELRYGTDFPRFVELRRLIPIQEKLVLAKLDGHPLFEQLGSLSTTLHTDD